MLAGVGAGHEILAAIRDPAHGPVEQAREIRKEDFFGIERGLDAKATANIRRNDPQAMLGEPEGFGDAGADEVRHLGGCPQCHRAGSGVELGKAAAGFHGNPRVTLVAKDTPQHHVGIGKGTVDIAEGAGPAQEEVVPPLRKDQWRIGG